MPAVTYVGRHSKDNSVSVYLQKRIFVDQGQGAEPIRGIVRVTPERYNQLCESKSLAVFVQVGCYFVYEALDYESDVLDCTLYEQRVQLFPVAASTPAFKYKITVPDRYHLPFTFELPRGLPPSTLLNPGYVFRNRPVGVSYEVCAFVAEILSPGNLYENESAAALRIVKASYFPIPENPPRVGAFAEKTYLGASRPLRVDASLDREIYRVGEPIQVRIEIRNNSSHDVRSLRITAKQELVARISDDDRRETYKCRVALHETSHGFPIRKHGLFVNTYTIVPTVLPQETYHVAQEGRVSTNDPGALAHSTRPEEGPRDRNGLLVSYYINVHAVVSMGANVVVRLPFILSGSLRAESLPSEEALDPSGPGFNVLVRQLVSVGYSPVDATSALKLAKGNFEKAFEWLSKHANKSAPASPVGDGTRSGTATPRRMSISFEDVEPPALLDETDARDGSSAPPASFADDILQASAVVGALTPLVDQLSQVGGTTPSPQPDVATCGAALSAFGNRLHDFLSEMSMESRAIPHGSAAALARACRRLVQATHSLVAALPDATIRLEIIGGVSEAVTSVDAILSVAARLLVSPTQELRVQLRNIADALGKQITSLRARLPGQREVELAISVIGAATAQLHEAASTTPPTDSTEIDTDALQLALDTINADASKLSAVFQTLGKAAEGSARQLADAAASYATLLPHILSTGNTVLRSMVNPDARLRYLMLLRDASASNSRVLAAARDLNLAPTDAHKRALLESAARAVVESMRSLLKATNALQTQLRLISPAMSPRVLSPPMSPRSSSPPGGFAPPRTAPSQRAPTLSVAVPPPNMPSVTIERVAAKLAEEPLQRADSFENFIFMRSGANPMTAPKPTETDIVHDARSAVASIEATAAKLSQARQRRQSFATGTQNPQKSSLIEQLLHVARAASYLLASVDERERELNIVHSSFAQPVAASADARAETIKREVTNVAAAVDRMATGGLVYLQEGDTAGALASIRAGAQSLTSVAQTILALFQATQGASSSMAQARLIENARALSAAAARLGSSANSSELDGATQQMRAMHLEQNAAQAHMQRFAVTRRTSLSNPDLTADN